MEFDSGFMLSVESNIPPTWFNLASLSLWNSIIASLPLQGTPAGYKIVVISGGGCDVMFLCIS